jgi:hypothetical protein
MLRCAQSLESSWGQERGCVMPQISGRRPSASLVVSLVALVIAASGTAVATSRLVSGDKLIKKKSLSGNRLRNHTLTRKQINLNRLGKVPSAVNADTAGAASTATTAESANHATSADTAANASHAASADSASNGARRIDFVVASATDPAPSGAPEAPGAHTLLSLDELTVTASCIDAGGGQDRVYVAFGSSSGHLSWEGAQFNNPGVTTVMDGTIFGGALKAFAVADLTGGNRNTTIVVVYRNASRTITANMTAAAETFASPGCQVEGTAAAAPS